jgi:hypothetical protein
MCQASVWQLLAVSLQGLAQQEQQHQHIRTPTHGQERLVQRARSAHTDRTPILLTLLVVVVILVILVRQLVPLQVLVEQEGQAGTEVE